MKREMIRKVRLHNLLSIEVVMVMYGLSNDLFNNFNNLWISSINDYK